MKLKVKDDDSDGTPFQGDGKTLSTCRMAFASQVSISLEDQTLLFLASQMQKEHFIDYLLVLLYY